MRYIAMKKYWIIENEMYSAYDTHLITNIFYGTWFEAARLCVKQISVKGDYRDLQEMRFDYKKSCSITCNYL